MYREGVAEIQGTLCNYGSCVNMVPCGYIIEKGGGNRQLSGKIIVQNFQNYYKKSNYQTEESLEI